MHQGMDPVFQLHFMQYTQGQRLVREQPSETRHREGPQLGVEFGIVEAVSQRWEVELKGFVLEAEDHQVLGAPARLQRDHGKHREQRNAGRGAPREPPRGVSSAAPTASAATESL